MPFIESRKPCFDPLSPTARKATAFNHPVRLAQRPIRRRSSAGVHQAAAILAALTAAPEYGERIGGAMMGIMLPVVRTGVV
jgi:hypothetical protein